MQIFEITKKYERQILFTVFIFGIIGIFWSFLADFGIGESGYNFLGKTKKITLSPEEPVTQTFTAHENNLSQIHFVMNNANIKNDGYLELQLMDGTCHDTITTKRFHSKPNKQGTYSIFEFAPIANSKDTRYCFSATYFSAENRKGEKPYLSATDVSDPLFSDRTLTDSNKNRVYPNQTLFLRPVYTSGSLIKDISELLYLNSSHFFSRKQLSFSSSAVFLSEHYFSPFVLFKSKTTNNFDSTITQLSFEVPTVKASSPQIKTRHRGRLPKSPGPQSP